MWNIIIILALALHRKKKKKITSLLVGYLDLLKVD